MRNVLLVAIALLVAASVLIVVINPARCGRSESSRYHWARGCEVRTPAGWQPVERVNHAARSPASYEDSGLFFR